MEEVNINIEGYSVNGICVGCLNYNRRMFYHPTVKEIFRLLGNIDVPDGLEVQVCWECLARVKSAINFKEQILKSYDFLISYSKEHKFLDSPTDFKPYATLNIERTEVEFYECLPETAAVGDEDREIDVKDEDNSEEKYAFEVAIKEETFDDPYLQAIPAIDDDVTSDEDVQLSKLKEKETEKVKKVKKRDRTKFPQLNVTDVNGSNLTYVRDKSDKSQQNVALEEPLVGEENFDPQLNVIGAATLQSDVNRSNIIYMTNTSGPSQENVALESHVLKENNYPQLDVTRAATLQSDVNPSNIVYMTNTPGTSQEDVALESNAAITERIGDLLAIADGVQQNQFVLVEMIQDLENKVLRKLSYLSAQFDTFTQISVRGRDKTEIKCFKIICNQEDLIEFEKQLENVDYREEIKKQLSCVCGKGKGRGLNNAYTLADAMFSRQLMTECSWAGGSKKNISKFCFKFYSKTIDLFFDLVHDSDNSFTRKECETFFKNVMRHSVTRNKPIQRVASSKRRPKKRVEVSANDNPPGNPPTADEP